jgi:RNA polymerase sigma-70 factor, ECF subfamily
MRPLLESGTINAGAMSGTHEVTLLLAKWAKGNQRALDELTPLVYGELRQLAASYLRKEQVSPTLQPTALEAYQRLVHQTNPSWQSRSHFFRMAARLMRQILMDHARGRRAGKRAGSRVRVSLDETRSFQHESRDLVALGSGLNALEKIDAQMQGRGTSLFGGLSTEEIAQALDVSPVTRAARLADGRSLASLRNAKRLGAT